MLSPFKLSLILIIIVAGLPVAAQTRSEQQSGPPRGGAQSSRSASDLYDEVANYERTKFAEFQAKKVPYDPKLRDQVVAERKKLATSYAAGLAPRVVSPADIFFLGLIYGLAADRDNTILTMQSYLTKDPAVESTRAQTARVLIVRFASAKQTMDLAESVRSDYLKHLPLNPVEHLALERGIEGGYVGLEKYDLAASHGEEALQIATTVPADGKPVFGPTEVYSVGSTLADIYVELKDDAKASATLTQMQKIAADSSSLPLYVDASVRLAQVQMDGGRKSDAQKTINAAIAETNKKNYTAESSGALRLVLLKRQLQLRVEGERASELTVGKWIGQSPVKLADLRGHVVMLDFWATWCAPCIASMPEMREINNKYKDKGLIIIGVTRYYGSAEGGKEATPAQELAYIEQFKKINDMPFGIMVAESDTDHSNYAAITIPTTVIIDQKGVVRFIHAGYSEGAGKKLTDWLDKVLAEK